MQRISDDLVERVARAICRAGICGPKYHLDEQEDRYWRKFALEARAAIAAIEAAGYVVVPREPTEKMIDAGNDYFSQTYKCAAHIWRTMIDCRIKEGD